MTDFRPECIINLHAEGRSNSRWAWSCSITREKHGTVVLARKLLGDVSREEAEIAALEYGFAQANRLLQEKVELCSTFAVEGLLEGSAKKLPAEHK